MTSPQKAHSSFYPHSSSSIRSHHDYQDNHQRGCCSHLPYSSSYWPICQEMVQRSCWKNLFLEVLAVSLLTTTLLPHLLVTALPSTHSAMTPTVVTSILRLTTMTPWTMMRGVGGNKANGLLAPRHLRLLLVVLLHLHLLRRHALCRP